MSINTTQLGAITTEELREFVELGVNSLKLESYYGDTHIKARSPKYENGKVIMVICCPDNNRDKGIFAYKAIDIKNDKYYHHTFLYGTNKVADFLYDEINLYHLAEVYRDWDHG